MDRDFLVCAYSYFWFAGTPIFPSSFENQHKLRNELITREGLPRLVLIHMLNSAWEVAKLRFVTVIALPSFYVGHVFEDSPL